MVKQAQQIYWRRFWLIFVPLEIVLYSCAFFFRKSLPTDVWQWIIGLLHPAILFVSLWAARNIVRCAGLSQEKQTTEVLMKSSELQPQ